MMSIEVVAAWPDHAVRAAVDVPVGSTLAEAVAMAIAESQELADTLKRLETESEGDFVWGIFGREADSETVLEAGARVELYRPLLRDPREARRVLASQGLDVTHPE